MSRHGTGHSTSSRRLRGAQCVGRVLTAWLTHRRLHRTRRSHAWAHPGRDHAASLERKAFAVAQQDKGPLLSCLDSSPLAAIAPLPSHLFPPRHSRLHHSCPEPWETRAQHGRSPQGVRTRGKHHAKGKGIIRGHRISSVISPAFSLYSLTLSSQPPSPPWSPHAPLADRQRPRPDAARMGFARSWYGHGEGPRIRRSQAAREGHDIRRRRGRDCGCHCDRDRRGRRSEIRYSRCALAQFVLDGGRAPVRVQGVRASHVLGKRTEFPLGRERAKTSWASESPSRQFDGGVLLSHHACRNMQCCRRGQRRRGAR